jgi:hypothetical protein
MYRFEKIFKTDPSKLEEELAAVLDSMSKMDDKTSEDYAKLNDQYKQLHALKEAEVSHKRISRDQIVAAAVHLAGIVAVINYEKIHVISTSAKTMVLKTFR